MDILTHPTRYLFFTGKGGVGKTSVACAKAVELADQGKRVLVVSTDPASNLNDVLSVTVSSSPTPVGHVTGLFALNIDPAAAAAAYRKRVVAPYRGVLDQAEISRMEEQLSGACTVEIAAFDEFATLLAGGAPDYDHVVFDTAPTGHTLRLLALPSAWTRFLDTNRNGASCLGPHSGLSMQHALYRAAVEALADPERTTLVLVARPERGALEEAARSSSALAELGLRNQTLVVNGVFRASNHDDPLALALERRGLEALQTMPDIIAALPRYEIPLRGHNIVGVPQLRSFFRPSVESAPSPDTVTNIPDVSTLAALVDDIEASGHGLVLVAGKGGVGKTTLAAAIAVELADRGLAAHLTTTDPAAHLDRTLETEIPGLKVSRIDPHVVTEAYIRKALATAAPDKSAEELEALEEDLRSPCTEEVAVFHAFSNLISGARREIVVMDTAPTGHTLLLLDATGSYHREMVKKLGGRTIGTPMTKLRDQSYTKVIVVTLAETTPVNEAAELQADLRRAGIEPYAWIVNASLAAAHPRDPVLVERAATERNEISRVRRVCSGRLAIVPWQIDEPTAPVRLKRLTARDVAPADLAS